MRRWTVSARWSLWVWKNFCQARLPALSRACVSGKLSDEGPGARERPVLEGFEHDGVVLARGLTRLVDQGGALLDERDLVTAKHAQFLNDGVFGAERTPGMAVGAQRVGQRPRIVAVGLGAAGILALAVAFGAAGCHRIHGDAGVDELLDDGSEARFDGDAEMRPGGDLIAPVLPAGGAVIEAEVRHEHAGRVHDDDVVVVAGPVKAGEVGVLWMGHGWCGLRGPGGCRSPRAGSCCYRSFMSWSSIRPWAGACTRTGVLQRAFARRA